MWQNDWLENRLIKALLLHQHLSFIGVMWGFNVAFPCSNRSAFPLSILSTLVEEGKCWAGTQWGKEAGHWIKWTSLYYTDFRACALLSFYSPELCDTDVQHLLTWKSKAKKWWKHDGKISLIYVNLPFWGHSAAAWGSPPTGWLCQLGWRGNCCWGTQNRMLLKNPRKTHLS